MVVEMNDIWEEYERGSGAWLTYSPAFLAQGTISNENGGLMVEGVQRIIHG